MSTAWNADGSCNEKSGFLFSHACDQLSTGACSRCSRPVCSEHTHPTEQGVLCTTCAKQAIKQERQQQGKTQTTSRGDYDYHDPYFYAGYYYIGYGDYHRRGRWGHDHYHSVHHDSHDFTEADGAAFAQQGDEDFETDMGES